MLNMAENSCINMIVNPTNTFLVNPEAHTSLQLLHRRSSDEDYGDDDDEEETEDEQGGEEEEELEEEDEVVGEIEEENVDDTLVAELNTDHLNHSTAPPIFSSLPSFPFAVGWGRGSKSRSISIVILFNFVF
jgi:hypothetical protein